MNENLELLRRLLRSNRDKVVTAAHTTKRHGKHYELVIGIGPDNVAILTLDDEALEALSELTGGFLILENKS